MASAAQGVRRVALELGGKNPNIVFDAPTSTRCGQRADRGVPALGAGVFGRGAADRAGLAARQLSWPS